MNTTEQVSATYFNVVEYVEADRSVVYAVQRVTYWLSDGAISDSDFLSVHKTRRDAEAECERLDATFPGA